MVSITNCNFPTRNSATVADGKVNVPKALRFIEPNPPWLNPTLVIVGFLIQERPCVFVPLLLKKILKDVGLEMRDNNKDNFESLMASNCAYQARPIDIRANTD